MVLRFLGVLLLIIVLGLLAFAALRPDATLVVGDEPVETTNDGDVVIDVEAAAVSFVNLTDDAATGFARIIGDFINQLYNVPQNSIVRVIMVIGGVILLLAGWRIYDWVIVIAGIVIGAATAVALVGENNTIMMVAALLIGGLIGAVIAVFAYYVAVFFIGAYIGLLLAGTIATSLDMTPVSVWILLLAALLGGILLLTLSYEMLVLLSSLVGAQLIVIALALQPQTLWIIGLTLAGIVLQALITRRYGYSVVRRPLRNPFRRAII